MIKNRISLVVSSLKVAIHEVGRLVKLGAVDQYVFDNALTLIPTALASKLVERSNCRVSMMISIACRYLAF